MIIMSIVLHRTTLKRNACYDAYSEASLTDDNKFLLIEATLTEVRRDEARLTAMRRD